MSHLWIAPPIVSAVPTISPIFYYELQEIITLDFDFLSSVAQQQGETVIYADCCSISSDEPKELGITFKEIPRDITIL